MSTRLFLLASMVCACALATPASSAPPSHATQAHVVQVGGMQPGEYHNAMTYTDIQGLPASMSRRLMSRPQETNGCLRTSDINAVVQDTIAAGANMTCSEDHGSASGGVISGAAACQDDDGNSGTLTFSGTYTATHADVTAVLNAQTQIGPVSEHLHLVSDRTGACS